MYEEIPEEDERFCFECSTVEDDEITNEYTLQKPVGIKIPTASRGCFGHRHPQWKWECVECGEIQW